MKYKEIINFLEKQNTFHSVDYLKIALKKLFLKIDPAKVILVAGTNGKGTTSMALQTLLVNGGKNVGFFSSPHLSKVNERIKFNSIDISDDDFENIFQIVHNELHSFNLSYFEYLTMMSAYYFFNIKSDVLDYAIFEIGLGGTHDSTNIFPHNISVITTIGFDHMNILGNTLTEIAENKFGIITDNNIVFHGKFNDEIKSQLQFVVNKHNAISIESSEFDIIVDSKDKYPKFFLKSSFGIVEMQLPGYRAAKNFMLAFTIFNYLEPNAKHFYKKLADVQWPGRMEKIKYQNRDIFISGDHNEDGVSTLLDMLKYFSYEKLHFIFGICSDKNHEAMLEKIINFPDSNLYLTETTFKHLAIENYNLSSLNKSKYVNKDPINVLDYVIQEASENDLVIVTGSLYLVGYIRSIICNA